MNNRVEIAKVKHKCGYNCSQAVFCTYCDLFGIDEETAFKLSEGFGSGMGGMRETCGAVTSMFMLAGLKNSKGDLEKCSSKKDTYTLIQELADIYKNNEGSIICRELLASNKETHKTCSDRIAAAAEIIEKKLASF